MDTQGMIVHLQGWMHFGHDVRCHTQRGCSLLLERNLLHACHEWSCTLQVSLFVINCNETLFFFWDWHRVQLQKVSSTCMTCKKLFIGAGRPVT